MRPPVVYSARYHVDIGPHVFPTVKYRLIHQQLLERDALDPADVVEPPAADWTALARVHATGYLDRIRSGRLTAEEIAQLELPWSAEMVDGFRLMTGGTMEAGARACGAGRAEGGPACPVACHVGGGLHHAFPGHGEGFCPFNDVAVAIRTLQAGGIERHAVVDLDVHHGNGTAFIFESEPRVFTFSMHQQHNYPLWKPRGSLDIGLPDGTEDEAYLRKLEAALPQVMASRPACVWYLAGADPYRDDQLGGLGLTKDGLLARDRMVIRTVVEARVPLVVLTAGGYARRVEDTVDIHAATITEAVAAAGPG